MSYTEQLERETEQTRQQVTATLDELRARMTPGQMVDQFVDYAGHNSGAEFLRNLKSQVIANPLPLTLVGAGLAWLMMSNGRSGGNAAPAFGRKLDRVAEGMSDATPEAGDSIAEVGAAVVDSARSTVAALGEQARASQARLGEAARSTAASIKDKVASTYGSAATVYDDVSTGASRTVASVAGSAGTLGRSAADSSRSFMAFCREQPLVLAGIGIALGAAVGAILPPTDTEDQLMGKTSDDAKEGLQDLAAQTYDKAKAVGERAFEAAQEEAETQGLATPRDPKEAELTPDKKKLPGDSEGPMRRDGMPPGDLWH